MQEPHQHIVFLVAIALSAIAGWLDWRRGEIPNGLTYGALALAPVLHVARFLSSHTTLETAFTEAGFSIGGAIACALVPLFLYRQGAIGGGDVKLLVALGALLQTVLGVEAQMYGFFAAALLAPAKLAYEGKLTATMRNAVALFLNFFAPKSRQREINEATMSWFRMGPAIFIGVALVAFLHW